jgi:hypothetical protein
LPSHQLLFLTITKYVYVSVHIYPQILLILFKEARYSRTFGLTLMKQTVDYYLCSVRDDQKWLRGVDSLLLTPASVKHFSYTHFSRKIVPLTYTSLGIFKHMIENC